jgi:hypothetical protein
VIALSMAAQTWSPSNEAPRPVTAGGRTKKRPVGGEDHQRGFGSSASLRDKVTSSARLIAHAGRPKLRIE